MDLVEPSKKKVAGCVFSHAGRWSDIKLDNLHIGSFIHNLQ